MTTEPLPHDRLYTRLRASPGKGVGVFAIRDIPAGLNPFVGDSNGTARVPAAVVDAIQDAELQRMYVDFCPLIDGHYFAPIDFNRMTVSWHMNHSERPNMISDPNVNFVAARLIRAGEELFIDYRTFSEHAEHFVAQWATAED
ncbi:MAG: SET domain-containing protein-lysine N-methyltransferase [Janthinobacterium lividum]